MRNFLLMVLAVVWPLTAHAGPNLNPEHGDAAYQAWSILSPDVADPSDYKDNVIVYFHGFRSAVPNGTYKRIRKKFKKTHTVLGVNYNYLNIAETVKKLDEFAETHLKGRNVTVFGTSLGGFWAEYFGNRIGANKIVQINPLSDPAKQLEKYAGTTQKSKRRQTAFTVTLDEVHSYKDVPRTANPATSSLVVLTADDQLLDHKVAQAFYASRDRTKVSIYPTGGHTIDLRKHEAAKEIGTFVWDK